MSVATARALTAPAQAGLAITARGMWAGLVQGAEALPQISFTFALLPQPDCGRGATRIFALYGHLMLLLLAQTKRPSDSTALRGTYFCKI